MTGLLERAIGALYSASARRLYEPVVVRTTLPLLAGDVEGRTAALGRAALDAAGDRPVLDVPVGTAHFALPLAAVHRGLYVGADYAAGMTEQAARAGRAAGLKRFTVVRADIHSLPFADGAFGAVLCINGLQVIPGTGPAVAELARVLAPGGRLCVSVVTLPVAALLPSGPARRLPPLLMSRRELVSALLDAGLAVASVTACRLGLWVEAVKPALPAG